ncbi:MAG: alpha/beta fold hydrolase, partial [Proteobacteria bacterium]
MKTKLIAFLSFFYLLPFVALAAETPIELRSRLDSQSQVEGVGTLAYRGPKDGAQGPTLVLVHGVYGGASHLAFREILPLLDAKFRVFLFDLPGAGASTKKDQKYTIESIEAGLAGFLKDVVKEPAYLVAESVSGVAALDVSKLEPSLVKGVIMLQPTGIRTLAKKGSIPQSLLYNTLRANDFLARKFYEKLSTPETVAEYAKKAYYNDALVDSLRIAEGTLAGDNVDQRWLTISFVGGRIYKPFTEAAAGVTVPVLAIFGGEAEAIGGGKNSYERPEEFAKAWPEMKIEVVPMAGASMQREKPNYTAKLIEDFV